MGLVYIILIPDFDNGFISGIKLITYLINLINCIPISQLGVTATERRKVKLESTDGYYLTVDANDFLIPSTRNISHATE